MSTDFNRLDEHFLCCATPMNPRQRRFETQRNALTITFLKNETDHILFTTFYYLVSLTSEILFENKEFL